MEGDFLSKLAWYISLAISLFGVFVLRYYFTLAPDESLKNINPAFIPLVFVIPFLLISLFISFVIGARYFAQAKGQQIVSYIVVLCVILALSTYLEYTQVQADLTAFGGGIADKGSLIFNFPIWNSYTNGWFVNEMIFFSLQAIAFGIGFFKRHTIELAQQEGGE